MKLHLLFLPFALVWPAFGQTPPKPPQPEIILPSKEKKPDDSRALAASSLPLSLNGLGLLGRDLTAYFPMDSPANGGLAWSRKPISVRSAGKVNIKEAEGRTYADFRGQGACLVFDPPLELGARFTVAGWIEAPPPKSIAAVWQGAGGLLSFKSQALTYWHMKTATQGVYAKTATPLTGWMHVAVTYDGAKTRAFLNGAPLDAASGLVSHNLMAIGNSPNPEQHDSMMAAGIDEQFFFNRNLTAEEITKVMNFSSPKK